VGGEDAETVRGARSRLQTLLASATTAARLVRDMYETDLAVEHAHTRDPVTAADRCSNALLVRSPRDAFPDVPMGSAGLKGAQVAEGGVEAYVHTGRGLKHWDVCAVDALVTAASGRVSDVVGAPIDYRDESLACERGLVASNSLTHEAILARLAPDEGAHTRWSA
jgi:3'-phosphoadenosine 5'-phosphosulfate (PAPS) 3'-phosphatase